MTPSWIAATIVGLDCVGEAEAILEAGAAAAVDREPQDRGLALARGDRRDARRGGRVRATMSVIVKIGSQARVQSGSAAGAVAADDAEQEDMNSPSWTGRPDRLAEHLVAEGEQADEHASAASMAQLLKDARSQQW